MILFVRLVLLNNKIKVMSINLDTCWSEQKDGTIWSSEYAKIPGLITSDNMFDGYQYYQTTEYMLGIKDVTSPYQCGQSREYNNKVFKGVITYMSNQVYGTLVFAVKIKNKIYYSSNGDVENIPLMKDILKDSGHNLLTPHDIERYMFKQLYNR